MKRTTTAYVAMNPRRCMACWKCVEKCPKKVIGKTGFLGHRHVIFENADACIGCNKCIKTCLQGVFFKPDASVSCTMNMGMAFRIEQLLPLAFVASAVTGIGLHIAGHGTSHETWHNWGVAHVVASFIWLLSVMAHVRRHKHWYKTLVSKRVTCKRLITFFLSIAFLIVAVTGILLVAYVEGPGSSIGLWHYKLGILLWVLSLIHALYRK
ncbi:ferredoxin family protein [Bacteroides sp. An19]|uniref:4Fe-4S dicluster domain-containing protein n=1 Tax=Bacteroides sp. An19 TaxID=1965580 RepID=UPI0019D02F5C|nr:ferredoxin family protein [Bacteroides sp. An19]